MLLRVIHPFAVAVATGLQAALRCQGSKGLGSSMKTIDIHQFGIAAAERDYGRDDRDSDKEQGEAKPPDRQHRQSATFVEPVQEQQIGRE